ncbi:hypothetical protein D3C72_1932730 [compost metagenome]
MHGGQHAGAHQKGAQQAQAKGRDRQQQGPAGEYAPLFRDRQRMHERGGKQPWHEGSILDRIPEPPAAPTQFVVGPGTAKGDAECQEQPGADGPWPAPACPE